MLTKIEISEQLKVHPNTIDKWRKMGMPCIKIGSIIKFEIEEVKVWMKENSEE